ERRASGRGAGDQHLPRTPGLARRAGALCRGQAVAGHAGASAGGGAQRGRSDPGRTRRSPGRQPGGLVRRRGRLAPARRCAVARRTGGARYARAAAARPPQPRQPVWRARGDRGAGPRRGGAGAARRELQAAAAPAADAGRARRHRLRERFDQHHAACQPGRTGRVRRAAGGDPGGRTRPRPGLERLRRGRAPAAAGGDRDHGPEWPAHPCAAGGRGRPRAARSRRPARGGCDGDGGAGRGGRSAAFAGRAELRRLPGLRSAGTPLCRSGRLRSCDDRGDSGDRHRLSGRVPHRTSIGLRPRCFTHAALGWPPRPTQESAMRRIALLSALFATVLYAAPLAAETKTEAVEWTVGDDTFSGWLVYDDEDDALRPGLVMVPNWMGVNDDALERARAVAGDDYVVLVADVYGKDSRPKDRGEAGRLAGSLRGDDRSALRVRMQAALDALRAQAGAAPLDATRIGAFGFCFGGSAVLELARSGADVAGVVSLHGGLAPGAQSETAARIAAPVLVLNGADDRAVDNAQALAFRQEMDAA